ncbi:MAG: aspartate/glutamate racemase family protein, partial [Clostridia bacterium]|nr:aspartate/glutamate racemase family protein [Clostridia bacterium]
MINKSQPIAVIDSGIGGATVLRELLKVMPNENYIYFGDSANAPYGTKTVEQVQALSVATAERMLARGIKGMVIACNTATAAAAAGLREAHPESTLI